MKELPLSVSLPIQARLSICHFLGLGVNDSWQFENAAAFGFCATKLNYNILKIRELLVLLDTSIQGDFNIGR